MTNRVPKISIEREERLFDGQFITVTGRHFRNSDTGKKGVWECVQRKTHGRIVAIAAITENRELILTKSFRLPVNSWVIELCAGLMDSKGESEENLVARELREETGYQAKSIELLMSGVFNAGLTDDRLAIFLGLDAVKVGEPMLENGEDIETLVIPLSSVEHFLRNQPADVIVDLKLYSVIYHPLVRGYIEMSQRQ